MNEEEIRRKKVEGWKRQLEGLKRRQEHYRRAYGSVPDEYVVDEEAFWKMKWEEDRYQTLRRERIGLALKRYKEQFGVEPRLIKRKQEVVSQGLVRGYEEEGFTQDCIVTQEDCNTFHREKKEYEFCGLNNELPYIYIRDGKQGELVVAFHCDGSDESYKNCVEYMAEVYKIYECKTPKAVMLDSTKWQYESFAKKYNYNGNFLIALTDNSNTGVFGFVEYCGARVFDNIYLYSKEYYNELTKFSTLLYEERSIKQDMERRVTQNGTPKNIERLKLARGYLDYALMPQEQSPESI